MNSVYFCGTMEGEEAPLELEARAKWPCWHHPLSLSLTIVAKFMIIYESVMGGE